MREKPATLRALVADAKRARSELSWTPHFHELETIIAHAWEWEGRVAGGGRGQGSRPSPITVRLLDQYSGGAATRSHHFNEFVLRNFGLTQYPSESANFDLAMHWHHAALRAAPHDDVASRLTNFCETQTFQCFDDGRPGGVRQFRHSLEG